ncbi:hypothetical protein [Sulfolobus spindle-shaped virus]|nr:hypothetical protein [Sulfolobus spindle-shaped virus]
MGLFNKSKTPNKQNNAQQKGERKKIKYVYLSSRKAIFIITGEPKEGKYGYSVPIIPVHGIYYASKEKKKYKAKELGEYYIILNIDKDDVDTIKGKKVVIMGYAEGEVLFVPANNESGEKNGNSKT